MTKPQKQNEVSEELTTEELKNLSAIEYCQSILTHWHTVLIEQKKLGKDKNIDNEKEFTEIGINLLHTIKKNHYEKLQKKETKKIKNN